MCGPEKGDHFPSAEHSQNLLLAQCPSLNIFQDGKRERTRDPRQARMEGKTALAAGGPQCRGLQGSEGGSEHCGLCRLGSRCHALSSASLAGHRPYTTCTRLHSCVLMTRYRKHRQEQSWPTSCSCHPLLWRIVSLKNRNSSPILPGCVRVCVQEALGVEAIP